MSKSKLGQINLRDAFHGFVVAFLTASLTGIIESLDSGHLPSLASVKVHALGGLTAGLAYIIKQFLQNDNGQLIKSNGVGGRPDDRNPPPPTNP
jgi:hypothetical protein